MFFGETFIFISESHLQDILARNIGIGESNCVVAIEYLSRSDLAGSRKDSTHVPNHTRTYLGSISSLPCSGLRAMRLSQVAKDSPLHALLLGIDYVITALCVHVSGTLGSSVMPDEEKVAQETKPAGHGYRTAPARLRMENARGGERKERIGSGGTEGYQLGQSRGDAAR